MKKKKKVECPITLTIGLARRDATGIDSNTLFVNHNV
jgi:hypothetical protein